MCIINECLLLALLEWHRVILLEIDYSSFRPLILSHTSTSTLPHAVVPACKGPKAAV